MPSENEPQWEVFQCADCASLSKFDMRLGTVPTCPTCGARLAASPPVEDDITQQPVVASPAPVPPPLPAGTPLITELGRSEPTDPQLDPERLKSTTEDELFSDPAERVRVKRSSLRVQKALTDWDTDDDTEAGTTARLERRDPMWQKALKVGAIAIVPAALVALIVYGIIAANKDKPVLEREDDITEATVARAALTQLEAATLDRDLSREVFTRAIEISEKFLNAPTWEDRIAFVREPERVRPLMQEYYARPGVTDAPIPHRPIKQSNKTPVHQSLILLHVQNDEFESFPIAIERDAEDEYRIDWESFVGYGKYTWDGMMEKRPTEPFLLRARVMPRAYYNYGFQDDTHDSWQLEDRTGDHRVYGYVERRGPLQLTLARHSKGPGAAIYMLLRVRYPEDAPAGDQLEIIDYVAQGWVAPAGGG